MRPQYALRASRVLRRYYSSNVSSTAPATENHIWGSETFESRVEELNTHYNKQDVSKIGNTSLYPRMPSQRQHQEMIDFRNAWSKKESEQTWEQTGDSFTINGKEFPVA
jgi:hypothetical protein